MLISKRVSAEAFWRCGYVRFNSSVPSLESSRNICQTLVHTYDYPAYLQTSFVPSSHRDAHIAIRALNAELTLIPHTIANPHARVMRMQFWRDAVEDCFQGKPRAEPVSILLTHVLSTRRLTKSFFQTVLSERVNPLC
jgi:phytoene/squalene synthetase